MFVRIDGTTGVISADTALPATCAPQGPLGMAVDSTGIAWVTPLADGKLCYFDTAKPASVGTVRDPDAQLGSVSGWGITVDRGDHVWLGGTALRYAPNRAVGFAGLGSGTWTRLGAIRAYGVAVDNRGAAGSFAYLCEGMQVIQVPASAILDGMGDQVLPDPGWPTVSVPCRALGVDGNQDLWAVSPSVTTRVQIDNKGVMSPPVVNGMPAPGNICPAGDSCPNDTASGNSYSDFTVGTSTDLVGSYRLVVPGCRDQADQPLDTEWVELLWDADVPAGADLQIHARRSDATRVDASLWNSAAYTEDGRRGTQCLQDTLTPNLTPDNPLDVVHDSALEVEVIFRSASSTTPTLRSLTVNWLCPPPI